MTARPAVAAEFDALIQALQRAIVDESNYLGRDVARKQELQGALAGARMELRNAIATLLEYVDVQESNLRVMCEESYDSGREITRLQRAVLDAEATAERTAIVLAGALDPITYAYNELRKLPARLTGEHPRPMGVRLDPVQPATQKGA